MRPPPPYEWSLPLPWPLFGAVVRVHILFGCVALGVVLWVATSREFEPGLWVQACVVLTMLLGCVLLHEFGHILAARWLDGDAPEIVLWPLGGLTFVDVPRQPRAWFRAALAGPVVNLLLAAVAAGALVALGFTPPPSPLASPLNPRMDNWREHKTYFSVANPGEAELWYYYEPDATGPSQVKLTFARNENGNRYLVNADPAPVKESGGKWLVDQKTSYEATPAVLGRWPLHLAQFFQVNWFLFWVNLLPAFPLDGAQMFRAWLWRRSDPRQATATAAYVGFLVMLAVGVYAIAVNDILPAALAAIIFVHCRAHLLSLERTEEEPPAGYDFSEGLNELERPDPPPPPPAKQGWLHRYFQQRREARQLREQQQREAQERRLDALLDKIHHQGRQALTDEELRFLTRMSNRYPNRK